MNSTKTRTGLKKNLTLNNVPGLVSILTEDDKENQMTLNIEEYLFNQGKGQQREFGKDITNLVSNCGDCVIGLGLYKNNKRNQSKSGSKCIKKNIMDSGQKNDYGSSKAFNNYFKKDPKLSNVTTQKIIPNPPNTMKNKDLVRININIEENSTTNFDFNTVTNNAANNSVNNNLIDEIQTNLCNNPHRISNNIFAIFKPQDKNERNAKINAYCRQRKNISLNLEYPIMNNVNKGNLTMTNSVYTHKNPFLPQKSTDAKERKPSSTRQGDISLIKTNDKSSYYLNRPKSNTFSQFNDINQINNDKENIDANISKICNLPRLERDYLSENQSLAQPKNISDFSNESSNHNSKLCYKQSHLNYAPVKQQREEVGQIIEGVSAFEIEDKTYESANSIPNETTGRLDLNFFIKLPLHQIPESLKDYLEDIFMNLKKEEIDSKGSMDLNYFRFQTDINAQMRAILIDWLIEVHIKFNLREETLFLTVIIIDRFLSAKYIPRSRLQLLGVGSMMVACKFEEILTPHVRDFVYITDKAYLKEEVLEMEKEILKVLDFNILYPSPLRFFELLAQFFKFGQKEFMFGSYMMQVFLTDQKAIKYPSSILACTSAYITMKFFRFTNYGLIYSPFFISNGNQALVKECARDIVNLLESEENSHLQAAKRKFARKDFYQVSLLKY